MAALTIEQLVILVVEPSTTQQHLMKKVCAELKVTQLDFVTTGEEAINGIPRIKPDVIISSLYLEDMSSDLLLKRLREGEGRDHIPFILVSSETRFERLDPLRQSGVAAILRKPFSREDLRSGLEHAMMLLQQDEIELENFDAADLRVLIVDDSPLARKHLRHLLYNMGMRHFQEADNGLSAIELLTMTEFDLVVTDLNMPAMDGDELVRHIRNSDRSFVPILMVTSEQNQSRLAAIQQAGVSAICDKPFEPTALRNALRQMLNHD